MGRPQQTVRVILGRVDGSTPVMNSDPLVDIECEAVQLPISWLLSQCIRHFGESVHNGRGEIIGLQPLGKKVAFDLTAEVRQHARSPAHSPASFLLTQTLHGSPRACHTSASDCIHGGSSRSRSRRHHSSRLERAASELSGPRLCPQPKQV